MERDQARKQVVDVIGAAFAARAGVGGAEVGPAPGNPDAELAADIVRRLFDDPAGVRAVRAYLSTRSAG